MFEKRERSSAAHEARLAPLRQHLLVGVMERLLTLGARLRREEHLFLRLHRRRAGDDGRRRDAGNLTGSRQGRQHFGHDTVRRQGGDRLHEAAGVDQHLSLTREVVRGGLEQSADRRRVEVRPQLQSAGDETGDLGGGEARAITVGVVGVEGEAVEAVDEAERQQHIRSAPEHVDAGAEVGERRSCEVGLREVRSVDDAGGADIDHPGKAAWIAPRRGVLGVEAGVLVARAGHQDDAGLRRAIRRFGEGRVHAGTAKRHGDDLGTAKAGQIDRLAVQQAAAAAVLGVRHEGQDLAVRRGTDHADLVTAASGGGAGTGGAMIHDIAERLGLPDLSLADEDVVVFVDEVVAAFGVRVLHVFVRRLAGVDDRDDHAAAGGVAPGHVHVVLTREVLRADVAVVLVVGHEVARAGAGGDEADLLVDRDGLVVRLAATHGGERHEHDEEQRAEALAVAVHGDPLFS